MPFPELLQEKSRLCEFQVKIQSCSVFLGSTSVCYWSWQ